MVIHSSRHGSARNHGSLCLLKRDPLHENHVISSKTMWVRIWQRDAPQTIYWNTHLHFLKPTLNCSFSTLRQSCEPRFGHSVRGAKCFRWGGGEGTLTVYATGTIPNTITTDDSLLQKWICRFHIQYKIILQQWIKYHSAPLPPKFFCYFGLLKILFQRGALCYR